MTLAVTGATGQLGRLVVEDLKQIAPSQEVLALVRSPEKAADLGIPAKAFDYNAPEGLASALDGIDTLLLISGSDIGKRTAQHAAVIDAAKEAGVGHIVYTSLLHADTSTIGLAGEHVATEAALKASGIPHTVLRNGWYTENYMMSVPAAIEHKALIGAAGEGKIASATRADFAEAAAKVLVTPELQGKTYELAGDDSYTLSELAAVISAQVGQEIPYINMPEAEFAGALAQAGMPKELAAFVAHCDTEASKGALFDDGRQLSKLIGRPTTPLAEAVSQAIA